MDFEREMEKNPMYNPYEYMDPQEIADLENQYASYNVNAGHPWYLPEGRYEMEITGAQNYRYREQYMFALELVVIGAEPSATEFIGAKTHKRYSLKRQLHFLKADLAVIKRLPENVVELGSYDFRRSLVGIKLECHVSRNKKGFITVYIDAVKGKEE